jgi:hypothetical protein
LSDIQDMRHAIAHATMRGGDPVMWFAAMD